MTVGNIIAIQRPAVIATSVSSRLATSKRCASCSSRTNARTTRTPVICSRSSLFTSSMRVCISRKLGTIRVTMNPIDRPSTGTTATISHDSPASTRNAMKIEPIIMMGAMIARVAPITTSVCTCWTSLVSRVINDGAPNCWISRAEKVPTRWKIRARVSRPNPIAVRAAK